MEAGKSATRVWFCCCFLLSFALNAETTSCPEQESIQPCYCDDDGHYAAMECKSPRWKAIRKATENLIKTGETGIHVFDLECDELQVLPNNSYGNLQLRVVKIKAAHLRVVEPSAFEGQANTLQVLEIVRVDILDFPLNAVAPLKELRSFRLSYSNLDRIPCLNETSWATKITKLYLSNNYVKYLSNGTLSGLTSLRLLDLSWNKIEHIEPGSIPLSYLSHLYLQNNELTTFPSDVFKLNAASLLNLESNEIGRMKDEQILEILRHKIYTELKGNPTVCDCEVAILAISSQNFYGSCKAPRELSGKRFQALVKSDFTSC